ncbi:MAG: hypothetical protein HYX40_03820 [Sphingobacteriales bacterium]|nr:hypothetical protein [Sphingobacteriales bacterium]
MKKLLGKVKELSPLEMKSIIGGGELVLTGTRYNQGGCYCDFMTSGANGGTWYMCNTPCSITYCQSSGTINQ